MPESEIFEGLLLLSNFILAFTHVNKERVFCGGGIFWRGLLHKLCCDAVNLNWSFV